jgi:N-methylhydantoinase A
MSSSDMTLRRLRLAADIGGTFTNVAAFDECAHRLLLGKSPSTPRAMAEGIEAGVAKPGTKFSEAGLFLHGSTGAINTVLERTGARTARVTRGGFRDVHGIGGINRADSYNLLLRKHLRLVPREHCDEVTERLYADGGICKPLDEAELHALLDTLAREEIAAVAILFLHCYRYPAHELRAKEILRQRLPGVFRQWQASPTLWAGLRSIVKHVCSITRVGRAMAWFAAGSTTGGHEGGPPIGYTGGLRKALTFGWCAARTIVKDLQHVS